MTIEFETKKISFKGKQCDTEIKAISCRMNTSDFEHLNLGIGDVKINDAINTQYQALSRGDNNPYFFLSEMKIGPEHPIYDGSVMTKEWADSFVDKLNNAPFPMSSLGHVHVKNELERAENNGYVVGGVVVGDSMVLKNYLLPGETPESKELANKTKREMVAKMLSTSISDKARFAVMEDEETGQLQWFAIESLCGQRNDIVEHDLTGGDAAIIAQSLKKNTDKSVNNKEKNMEITSKEMITKLQNLKNSGDLSVEEIAKAFNLKLVTKTMTNEVTLLSNLKKEIGEGDPIEIIKNLKAAAARVDESEFNLNKDKAVKEVFENENLKKYAEGLFNLKAGNLEDCKAEAKRVSELPIMKDYASSLAGDMSKGLNLKTGSENSINDPDAVVKL